MCIVTLLSLLTVILAVTLKRCINYIRIVFEEGFLITICDTFLGSYCTGTHVA